MIDLIRQVAIYFNLKDDKDKGKTQIEKPIPEEYKEKVATWRHELIEKVSETDDRLMGKYLNNEEFSEEDIRAGLRAATISFKLHPVFCGSALKYVGVQRLLTPWARRHAR